MKIIKYANTSPEEIKQKKYNIWIGISLRNKLFTKKLIEEYIKWSLNNTKNSILIVIPDRLEAINYETLEEYNKLRAFKVANRKGDEVQKTVENIISNLSKEEREKIVITRWRDVENTKYHAYRVEILFEEFKKKKEFYNKIIKLTKERLKNSPHTITNERLEKLSEYFIYEIPLFLNGAKYGGLPENGGKTYLLQIYPGFGEFDELLLDLQDGKIFPELSKKLKITDKMALLDAYVE